MLGTNQYDLTWENFENLHTNKANSFENLCRSLFFRELCCEHVILHSDSNHPGVEVTPVLAKDGKTYISFQAKYFDDAIKYQQILHSVEKVVDYYANKLNVLYLYCNKDISEACDSYKKITKLLNDNGIRIELVTGQTILDQALNYSPILSCYFGLDSLDRKWFQRNIELSLENLGPRYNSIFNVDTEAQRNIALFLGENDGIVEINKKKEELIDKLNELRWNCNYRTEIESLLKWANSLEDVNKNSICSSLKWKEQFENECNDIFTKLNNRLHELRNKIDSSSYNEQEYKELISEETYIGHILFTTSLLDFTESESRMLNSKAVIVNGNMGTGKSQLLATAAKRMIENGRPALLLLGQTFISADTIEKQIMDNLEGLSSGQNFESLVAVMDEQSELIGEDSIIFIDAINESSNRDAWKNGINRILITLKQYRHVKMVVSVRTGFEELTLSSAVLNKIEKGEIARITHTGLVDNSPRKIYEFLFNCGVPFSPEYYLHSEMTNPLFLTWFCKTYSGEEQGLLDLIDKVLTQADKEGSKAAGLEDAVGMLKPLVYEILDSTTNGTISKTNLLKLTTWDTYGVNNKIGYLNAIERFGVLSSFIQNGDEDYYIGYNLLEEYLIADRIVSREIDKEKILEYCEKNLLEIDSDGNIKNYGNESVFAMVASVFSIKIGGELIELIDKVKDDGYKYRLTEEYCSSFIWRSSFISFDEFLEIINKYPVEPKRIWEVFIENAVKEKSALNAFGLTKMLNRYDMNRRDLLWTTVINNYDENNRIISLSQYIESGNMMDGLTDRKAFLLSITYAWMLSSSNRSLRDRVSKAMIEILKDHFSLCKQLLELFKNVNDPYIIQRLYGVVFGAVMKRKYKDKTSFVALVQWIYKEIFDKEMVYPDILLRDYARLIIERFAVEYPEELTDIHLERVRPPYKSEPLPRVEEINYGADEYQESDLRPLLYSMKFDMDVKGIGMYGDFGRYVFQSALDNFVNLDLANTYYYSIQYILNDLGYKAEWFAKYDKTNLNYDRHHVKKIERIGKKYQWIAMYNILARVSDTHSIRSWDRYDKKEISYEGPWNPFVRDFDPTLNTKIRMYSAVPQIKVPKYGCESFCDINSSAADIEKWTRADDQMFRDYPDRLILTDETGKEWVSVYAHNDNSLKLNREDSSAFGFPKGEQRIWSISTMFVIPPKEPYCLERDLIDTGIIDCVQNRLHSCYSLFSREYAWSPGYHAELGEIDEDNELNAFPAAVNASWESEYDASQENETSFIIPAGQIIQKMQLYEKSVDGIYYRDDEIVALDLTLIGNEQREFVIRRDLLDEYISKTGVTVFWKVNGEKQFFLGELKQEYQRREGYFVYSNNRINGSICIVDKNNLAKNTNGHP